MPSILPKQLQIKQAKNRLLVTVTVTSVIVVFCLVAGKGMLSNAMHQRRVLDGKNQAIAQLKADITAVNSLSTQYQAFNSAQTNLIGGSSTGNGPNDGANSQIVLDALPSQYDFPGLTASVEKILTNHNVKLGSISGVDNEAANIPGAVANPQPVTITFSFSATSTYQGIKQLFTDFQSSIRPFHVVSVQLTGTDAQMTVNATINTYYQPAKTVSITSKEVL